MAAVAAFALLGLDACGSDEDSKATATDGGGGASADGSAGSAGTGGMAATMECAPCPPPQIPDQLSALLGAVPLPECCIDATRCGVNLDQAATVLSGALGGAALPPLGCQDPSVLTGLLGDGGAQDSGIDITTILGGGVPVLDGGIIAGDGGAALYVLDDSCSDITVNATLTTVVLPGCCRPDGTCGASSHELVGGNLPIQIPLTCGTSDEVQAVIDAQSPLPGLITATPTPESTCTYPLGGGDGGGDGGASTPKDASATGDAG